MCEYDKEVEFDYDELTDTYLVACPCCGAVQDQAEAFQGTLGTTDHYRCRQCGARFYD